MPIVFMGSPPFAVPSLKALATRFTVAGVITQPDRQAGRGRKPAPPAVKLAALELGIPVFQPRRLREPEALAQLVAWSPDLIVVAAFGQILPQAILDLPAHGCVNVHASLLPRWRGAAPIQAAIAAGDAETGATIMVMDAGIDTGPILAQSTAPIPDTATSADLSEELSHLGAELLVDTLPAFLEGSLSPRPQPTDGATYAPLLSKDDGRLDFRRPAAELARQVRAYEPWPASFFEWGSTRITVREAQVAIGPTAPIASIQLLDKKVAVRCSTDWLVLTRLQPAGKRPMTAVEFAHGAPGFVGSQVSA